MQADEIAKILRLSDQAYNLILHLASTIKNNPYVLSKKDISALQSRRYCLQWISKNSETLPSNLIPTEKDREAFSNLFWSFFQISFSLGVLEWDGEVLDADIRVTRNPKGRNLRLRQAKEVALSKLFQSRNLPVPPQMIRMLIKGEQSKAEVSLWTYVWELRQRSRGKAKGKIVHKLWRSIPYDMRKNISPESVLAAADQLVARATRRSLESIQR